MPLHFDPWWLPWQSPLKELQYLLPEGILVADEQGNVFLLPRHSLTAQTWIMQCLYRFLSVFHVLLMWFACLRNFSSELQQATFWKQIGSLHCTGMSFSGIVQCFQASTARVRRWNTIKYDLYDRTTCTTVRPVRPYDLYDLDLHCHHCQITAVCQVLAFVACCHTHWLWAWDSPRSSAWAKSSVWLGL